MAQIEYATDMAAKIYRRQAERRGLADNGQAKADNVIDLRAKRKAENQAWIWDGKLACKWRPPKRAK